MVNGVTLAYREMGSGYPLLLINGFASTMDTWNPLLLSLIAHHFRVIIFDNRGTGYSTASDEPFSISLFAEDTAALMDACGIDCAHVLGLSMGASIAQEMILSCPGRVGKLMLVAGTCGGTEGIRMEPGVWNRLSDKSGELPEIAHRMFSVLFPDDWLATHEPWKYCPEVHETTSVENAGRQADAFFSWTGSFERLPTIRCPVLVITGTEDVVIPPENTGILAKRIPGARVVRIQGTGHGLQYQEPRALGREIISFLSGIRYVSEHSCI